MWLKRAYTDINGILQQLNNGTITLQMAAKDLRNVPDLQITDVCSIIANMVDSMGYLAQLSGLLRCGETIEQSPQNTVQPESGQPGQPEQPEDVIS